VRSCTGNAQCAAPTSHCNTTTDRCVQCLASTDCAGGGGAGGALVCDTTTDDCVQCVTNADCKNAARPMCDTNVHACVQCLSKTDCDSGVCNFAGICGPG
jgi:Cys-rich repeat protein